MLFGYTKSGSSFPCHAADVCRIWNDDINELFPEAPDVLGTFRRTFEPRWNLAIEKVRSRSLAYVEKTDISGYLANLMTCTPATQRMFGKVSVGSLKRFASFAKDMQLKHGTAEQEVPVEAIEAVEEGKIDFVIDPKYLQAQSIRRLLRFMLHIRNQDWVVVENRTALPLITSDNPFCVVPFTDLRTPLVRILPLTPYHWLEVTFSHRDLPELTIENGRTLLESVPTGSIKYAACDSKAAIRD
jgi:hypothetical protein